MVVIVTAREANTVAGESAALAQSGHFVSAHAVNAGIALPGLALNRCWGEGDKVEE